ncbi:MAG: HAMP domain-containing histidine kinase [Actinobacteria bacterium]|nr:HAMP domain-containing histidine kinase [Actinomycetota bacterium]
MSDPQRPDSGNPAAGTTVVTVVLLLCVALALVVMARWIVVGEALLYPLLGTATTKLLSASAALALSLSLLSWVRWQQRTLAAGLACVALAIGAVGLIELIATNWGSPILSRLEGGPNLLSLPGWNSSTSFLLLAVSVLLLVIGRAIGIAQVLAAVAALIAYLAMVGKLMLVDVIFPNTLWTQMAWTTLVPVFALAVVALWSRAEEGLMAAFMSPWLGSKVARILVYVTMLVGILLAIAVRIMVYLDIPRPIPAQIIVALLVPAMVVLAGFLAIRINRMDRLRTRLNAIDAAVSSSMQGVLLVDRQGLITDANDAAGVVVGLLADKLPGRPLSDFFAEVAALDDILERISGSSQPVSFEPMPSGTAELVNTEITDVLGRSRSVDVTVAALGVTNVPGAFVVTIRDTSELARANKSLEEFAYVASHDLRAPLRTIAGFAGILSDSLEGDDLDELQREAIEEIDGGVARMQQLIDALLSYARLGGDVRPAELSVVATVAAALDSLRADLEEADASVATEIPENLRWSVDEGLFTAALVNIMQNSVKYRSPERPLKLAIVAARVGGNIRLTITDNGRGIPPDQLDRATNMFQRLTREGDGLGIGLASVQRSIELNGGTLKLSSDGETYTTAQIVIPSS